MIKNSVMLTHVKRENLFLNHLKQIGDMNFTLREIDIIACIINNRGDKKIDFVEKYGKTKIFRQYYAELLSEASFNNYLAKIKKLLNNNDITIDIITKESAIAKNIPLLQQLKKHLALANIVLEINSVTEKSKSTSRTVQLDLYLENSSENISLVFNKNTKSKTIDFRDEDNYYFLVTELLSSIIDKAEINKINDEFILDYQSILASNTDFTISEKIISETQQYNIKSNHFGILIFLIIGGCIFFYFNLDHLKQKAIILTETENIYKTMPKFFEDLSVRNLTKEEAEKNYSIIKQFAELSQLSVVNSPNENIKSDLQTILQEFSANNVYKESLQKNHSLIKKVERLANKIIENKFNKQSERISILSEDLTSFCYIIHALSAYYLFNEHDGIKARSLLEKTKAFIEDYVSSRNKIELSFSKLILITFQNRINLI